MGRGSFLTFEERQVLTELARDGLVEHRLARRANALILLDRGMSYAQVAKVLLLDDTTIRQWRTTFEADGVDGLVGFHYGGRHALLSPAQEEAMRAWVRATLPRTTREVGAYIEAQFGVTYESRSGLVALLHRLGFVHRKPQAMPSRMDPQKQARFIADYENLLNRLQADEMVMFADAVHPTYGARPVGREHINIHGALDLETSATCMLEVGKVDAQSTLTSLRKIEAQFADKRVIHVGLDNARCHHAHLVRDWLARPGRRIWLFFVPPYCPHLNPIERLWGLMHKTLIHNRCPKNLNAFRGGLLAFLRQQVPQHWAELCDQVTDNFRIRNPAEFRIVR